MGAADRASEGVRRALVVALILATLLPARAAAAAEVHRCPQWERALAARGLPVAVFSRTMWRESRCNPDAIGWNYRRGKGPWNCHLSPARTYRRCKAVASFDLGLMQVNSSWVTVTANVCGTPWGDVFALLNPRCNLDVAAYLYAHGGLAHWGYPSAQTTQHPKGKHK